jgi:hypothetical protein
MKNIYSTLRFAAPSAKLTFSLYRAVTTPATSKTQNA